MLNIFLQQDVVCNKDKRVFSYNHIKSTHHDYEKRLNTIIYMGLHRTMIIFITFRATLNEANLASMGSEMLLLKELHLSVPSHQILHVIEYYAC